MNPKILAMYALLVVGGFAVVAAIVHALREGGSFAPGNVTVVVLGFGMMGVGGFGPAFIGDYIKLVDALRSLQEAEDPEAQREVAARVATQYAEGEFAEEDWPLIAAALREQAVPQLPSLLERAADTAPPASPRRQMIASTKQDVVRYERFVARAVTAMPDEEPTAEEHSAERARPEARVERDVGALDTRTLRTLRNDETLLRERHLDRPQLDALIEERARPAE